VLRTLTAITLALLATVSYAQIYKQVDEDGNVTFTDQPPADGQPVELGTTNTAPPPVNAYPRRAAPSEKAAKSTYTATITSPANETIIPNGPGNFSVSATVSPALQGDHRLQLLIDGTPVQEPQKGGSWSLTNVFRGEHSLVVSVIDETGAQVTASEPVIVFVFRPSTHKRAKPTPRN
jgi:hypothetical protein